MSDGRLKAAIQITAELTAMARAEGYRAGAEAMREVAASEMERTHDRWGEIPQLPGYSAQRIRSLPIPEIDR